MDHVLTAPVSFLPHVALAHVCTHRSTLLDLDDPQQIVAAAQAPFSGEVRALVSKARAMFRGTPPGIRRTLAAEEKLTGLPKSGPYVGLQ